MKINIPQKYFDEKLINKNKHPILDVFIYNYTPKVQYEKLWDDITLMCRGLILDSTGEIIARPIPKFFNLGEIGNNALPTEPFIATDKIDGSLIIITRYKGDLLIASRGSFTSEQAIEATQILNKKYLSLKKKIEEGKTYLYEVIYPENRVVVDYGAHRDLVGLAIVDNETGKSCLMSKHFGFAMPHRYYAKTIGDINLLASLNWPNKEGVVLYFPNSDFRVKIKFDEYVHLHRIITGYSELEIWRNLRYGVPMNLVNVPEEFSQYVKETILILKKKFRDIESRAKVDALYVYKRPCQFSSRKKIAEYVKHCLFPSIVFAMLDGKKYCHIIWKMIRPKGNVL